MRSLRTITHVEQHVASPKLHRSSLLCVTLLRDNRIATGSRDGSISLSLLNTHRLTWSTLLHKPNAHSGEINYITETLIANHHKLVSCSDDGTIKTWNSSSPNALTLETAIHAHSDKIYQVISLSNSTIISCSDDNTVRLWNSVLAQHLHFPYETQKQPRALLALKHQADMFAVSCCGGKGYVTAYSQKPPYEQQGVTVNEVYTRWSHGMIDRMVQPSKIYCHRMSLRPIR